MSAEFEAQILADLRRTHAQLKKTPPSSTPAQGNGVHGWSMRLTVEEVDLLLKIVDERDDLKRRLLSDWEPDHIAATDTEVRKLGGVDGRIESTTSCPFADTVHDCPLGGCPDASPREVQIPDLPTETSARLAPKHPAGREARETPPRTPLSHATMCSGRDDGGGCFVPWCSCDCHTRRADVAPAR